VEIEAAKIHAPVFYRRFIDGEEQQVIFVIDLLGTPVSHGKFMKYIAFFHQPVIRFMHRGSGLLSLLLLLGATAWGTTGGLLILHTNDIHDHVRPGYIGIGGLPYISGYVRQVREERDDVLLLDAGDVLEKGDLVAFRTRGEITFEAMAQIGYDAITIGNHDLDFGLKHLRRFEELMEQKFLLLNLFNPEGTPEFTPSRIIEVKGVKVGVIGMIAPRKAYLGGVDHKESARLLAEEAERLKQEVHLVVALCHEGTRHVREWAKVARAVDVFITGHHHETLLEPIIVEETGAIIVQAGSDAKWVGRLELEIDLEAKRVADHHGELVLMQHDTIPADEEMIAWLAAREAEIAPEANEFVIDVDKPVGWFGLGRLASEAIRKYADADVGFYHPTQIVRNSLPAGPVDLNAIFRISAERVDPLLRLQMTGAEIATYMNGLSMSNWGLTQWAGFSVDIRNVGDDRYVYEPDLDPDRIYSVVMPEREWQRYFTEIFLPAYVRTLDRFNHLHQKERKTLPRRNFPATPVEFTFVEAAVAYLREIGAAGEQLQERLERLREAQGDADPNEARYAPRFRQRVDPSYYHDLVSEQ